MSITIGASGEIVRRWQLVMVDRFKAYAKAADGGPLKPDAYFGFDDQAVQREYQRRTGQPQTGLVSEDDLIKLGAMAVLFTLQGTGVDMWTGYPADTARACLDLCHWQPIGNYPADPFPMWQSIIKGIIELRLQLRDYANRYPGYRIWLDGYSQGAIVIAWVFKHDILAEDGILHDLLPQVKKAVTHGSPMRELGKANGNLRAGWPIPDGHGILYDRLEGTPDWWLDFAHGANSEWGRDLYTDVERGARGDNESAICDIVMQQTLLSGPISLAKRVAALIENPIEGLPAVVESIYDAGMFFGSGTGPHVNYDIGPAIDYLRTA